MVSLAPPFKRWIYINMEPNKYKEGYNKKKKERRELKRTDKRTATGEEVIFIFEKILEGWKTIKIFNTIIQTNPASSIDKKKVESIATGNCKVHQSELTTEKYDYYLTLREKVYESRKRIVNTK
jgi:hypothetical protein